MSAGLADLVALVTECGAAGLFVDLAHTGQAWPLPPAMDLTAYRILQEALTNVLRHSGAATARVEIGYRPEWLRLTVRDDGTGAAADRSGGGHGQLGMRERVAGWGGQLQVGPLPDGGYEVVAELPRGQEE